MKKIQQILAHRDYKKYLVKIQAYEEEREFCKHDMTHFLDVARIACILNLEENLKIDKEVIYAAAVLHDIGRWVEYKREGGISHACSSAVLADFILTDIGGFSESEVVDIMVAIIMHRDSDTASLKNLAGILYRADKLSRMCMFCSAHELCDKVVKNGQVLV